MAAHCEHPAPTHHRLDPSWVAVLESGETFVGKPSWLSGGNPRLPDPGMTDWRRLMAYCGESGKRLKSLTLFVPGCPPLLAPEGKGAYGYFETVERKIGGHSGVAALGICWPEDDGRGERIIKVQLIRAEGILECQNRHKWQPCMIGNPEWKSGKDDGTPYRDGTPVKGN